MLHGIIYHSLRWVLTTATQAQHQVQGGLLLDVVVCQGAAILQLLAGEDQALLVRRDPCKQLSTLDVYELKRFSG